MTDEAVFDPENDARIDYLPGVSIEPGEWLSVESAWTDGGCRRTIVRDENGEVVMRSTETPPVGGVANKSGQTVDVEGGVTSTVLRQDVEAARADARHDVLLPTEPVGDDPRGDPGAYFDTHTEPDRLLVGGSRPMYRSATTDQAMFPTERSEAMRKAMTDDEDDDEGDEIKAFICHKCERPVTKSEYRKHIDKGCGSA